jgi:hypothetical protein
VKRILVGKTEKKRSLGWNHNIKMDLHEVVEGCGDWMDLAQDRTCGGRL